MENKNRRIDYIDYAKGIAIILVLVCHIRGAYYADSIQNIIALFHNSTFFLISGVLFSIKSNNSMGEFLTKKIKRLIKPFCVWIIIYSILIMLVTNQYNVLSTLVYFANCLWFLPILFIGLLELYLIYYFKVNLGIVFVIQLVSIIVVSYYSSFVAKMMAYALIVICGQYLSKLIQSKSEFFVLIVLGLCIFCMCKYISMEDINSASGWKLLIFLFAQFLGGIVVINFSKRISSKCMLKWLKSCGENSIYIYILHILGIFYIQNSSKTLINFIVGLCLISIVPWLYIILGKKNKIDRWLF